MFRFRKDFIFRQAGFTPIRIVLAILVGVITIGGIIGGITYFARQPESLQLEQGLCGDGICQDVERQRGVCDDCRASQGEQPITPIGQSTGSTTANQQPATQTQQTKSTTQSQPKTTTTQSSTNYGDNSFDADGFLWGTEVYPDKIDITKSIINSNLKTKNLKARVQLNFFSKDGSNFSSTACMPSASNCKQQYNMDDVADKFKENGWSMMPMLSHDISKTSVSTSDIDSYVNFVDWFVGRYKDDANIKYIELINSPAAWWDGTTAQLLDMNNKTYDRIKSKYPDIKVGTPGFEYETDSGSTEKGIQIIEYFLDKNNGAKFDFFAFHGYPLMDDIKLNHIYPPTKNPINNKYGGIKGILEIRKIMDSNGWTNRLIIDTEHTAVSSAKPTISDSEDELDAAYIVQELTLKKVLRNNGSAVLSGIMPLKIAAHGSTGEFLWASLKSDGSLSRVVKSMALLITKLNEYAYSAHISGEFDNESTVWVEKFISSDNKELYVYFKPFKYNSSKTISFDNETINYSFDLPNKPKSVILTDFYGNQSNLGLDQKIIFKAMNQPKFVEVSY